MPPDLQLYWEALQREHPSAQCDEQKAFRKLVAGTKGQNYTTEPFMKILRQMIIRRHGAETHLASWPEVVKRHGANVVYAAIKQKNSAVRTPQVA